MLNEDEQINKRWNEYIGEKLYYDNGPENYAYNQEFKMLKINITEEELQKTINSLSKHKAGKCDNIPAEFYQSLDGRNVILIRFTRPVYFQRILNGLFL